jgi:hypothetical protein
VRIKLEGKVPQLLLMIVEARVLVKLCLCETLVQACQLDKLQSILVPDITQLLDPNSSNVLDICPTKRML